MLMSHLFINCLNIQYRCYFIVFYLIRIMDKMGKLRNEPLGNKSKKKNHLYLIGKNPRISNLYYFVFFLKNGKKRKNTLESKSSTPSTSTFSPTSVTSSLASTARKKLVHY